MLLIGGHGQITSETFSSRNHQLNDVFGTLKWKWEDAEKGAIIFFFYSLNQYGPKKNPSVQDNLHCAPVISNKICNWNIEMDSVIRERDSAGFNNRKERSLRVEIQSLCIFKKKKHTSDLCIQKEGLLKISAKAPLYLKKKKNIPFELKIWQQWTKACLSLKEPQQKHSMHPTKR